MFVVQDLPYVMSLDVVRRRHVSRTTSNGLGLLRQTTLRTTKKLYLLLVCLFYPIHVYKYDCIYLSIYFSFHLSDCDVVCPNRVAVRAAGRSGSPDRFCTSAGSHLDNVTKESTAFTTASVFSFNLCFVTTMCGKGGRAGEQESEAEACKETTPMMQVTYIRRAK